MEPARIVPVEYPRMVDALDTIADVAAALERHADRGDPLDADRLIAVLRGVVADFAFDLDAAAHLP